MALKISEIPTALSEITNETLVEVSEKSGETYTTKKFDLKKIIDDIAVSPPHGDEAHTEDYIKEGDSRLTNARMPLEHAQTHVDGTDDIQLATSTQKGLMSSAYAAKLDEAVTGPTSAVDGNLPVFDGATGKIIKDAGIALNPLTSSVTLKVGSGEQFPTINAALEYAVKKYYPIFLSGGTKPRVTIQLQAGFVMAEQVLVESLDLSWITITGVDAETVIDRSALTTPFGLGYPAFGVVNGGFLPIIGQLFNMNTSGTASDRHGILAFSNSRAIVLDGCGVKNAGSFGIYAGRSSTIIANGADASGAGTCGIFVADGSLISANGADASGAGTYGIFVADGSLISANGADASGAGTCGICAANGSLISANGADASGAGTHGIYVAYGSLISANGATGTLNQAKNTLTANGIIFQ